MVADVYQPFPNLGALSVPSPGGQPADRKLQCLPHYMALWLLPSVLLAHTHDGIVYQRGKPKAITPLFAE